MSARSPPLAPWQPRRRCDCGRVPDMPYTFVDGVAKLIPFAPGKWTTLAPAPDDPEEREANTIYAKEAEPLLVDRERNEEEVAELFDLAAQVEGLPRQRRHARGWCADRTGKAHRFLPALLCRTKVLRW